MLSAEQAPVLSAAQAPFQNNPVNEIIGGDQKKPQEGWPENQDPDYDKSKLVSKPEAFNVIMAKDGGFVLIK